MLTGEHRGTLGEVFASVGADLGAELVELDAEDDQVHLLVAYPQHVAVARLVHSRKGVSARRLPQALPGLHPPGAPVVAAVVRGLGWWRTLETLRAYIRQQRTAGRANPALNGGFPP